MPPKLQEKPTVECPACGATNPLGRLLCSRCGERLNFDPLEPTEVKKQTRKSLHKPMLNGLISLVVVWSVVTLLLYLWPFAVLGQPGDARRGAEARVAFLRMEQALSSEGVVPPTALTEMALNSYFLERGGEERELRLEIEGHRIVAVAREPLGPLGRSSRIVLSRADRDTPFRVESVWAGHLPLPKSRARSLARGLASRFELEIPPEFFDSLVILEAERNRVLVGTPAPQDDL